MSPGDKVSYINTKLSGTVKRIIDKKQVLLLLDDGFEIPANISELVVTERIGGNNPEGPNSNDAIIADDVDTSDKIYFGAITEDTGKGLIINAYLVNTTSSLLQFALYKTKEFKYSGLAHGEIEPSRAMKVLTFQMADASDYKNLVLQYLLYADESAKLVPPAQVNFKIKPVALFKERNLVPVLRQQGFLLDLTDLNPDQATEVPLYMRPMQKSAPVPDIIDLHLEELTEKPKNLTPPEAIQLQMSVFNQSLEKAIAQDLDNITFIHGVGKGILKEEIKRVLASNPYIHSFADADPKKFGQGATVVYIKNR